jgi:hypothetical protein
MVLFCIRLDPPPTCPPTCVEQPFCYRALAASAYTSQYKPLACCERTIRTSRVFRPVRPSRTPFPYALPVRPSRTPFPYALPVRPSRIVPVQSPYSPRIVPVSVFFFPYSPRILPSSSRILPVSSLSFPYPFFSSRIRFFLPVSVFFFPYGPRIRFFLPVWSPYRTQCDWVVTFSYWGVTFSYIFLHFLTRR